MESLLTILQRNLTSEMQRKAAEHADVCKRLDATSATARVLKTHYVVERQEYYDGSVTVVAQFHSIRDAKAFIQATKHSLHRQRIVCITKRSQAQKAPNPWID